MQKVKQKVNRIFKAVSSNKVLESGYGYGEIGMRVFPLEERSKEPRLKFRKWPERATTSKKAISKWFKDRPLSNLGIAMGNGLVAIDLDPKSGGFNSFKKLVKGRKLPFTAVAETGSGGRHYLFRLPPGIRVGNSTGLLPGIDVKGDGGYIVVEPSLHPNGRRYRWIYGPEQGIAQAPAWLVKILLTSRTSKDRKPRDQSFKYRDRLSNDRKDDESALLADVLEKFPVTATGQRYGKLAKVIGSLIGRGYEIGIVQRVALRWWEHFYRQGAIGTDLRGAEAKVDSVIDYTLRNSTFKQSNGKDVDHEAEVRKIWLAEEKIEEIRDMLKKGAGLNTCNSSNKERRDLRQAFVEALVIHFTHERACKPYGPLKATWTQITEIMKDRHGLSLRNPEIDRLMSKFIKREGRPASLCELAVQTVKGKTGVPSEYQLTGLRELLGASPLNSFIPDVQSVHP